MTRSVFDLVSHLRGSAISVASISPNQNLNVYNEEKL